MSSIEIYSRYGIPRDVTVLIDTREKRPILFPSTIKIAHPERIYIELPINVETKKSKLSFGDYALEGHESVCVFERKASQLEIYKNLNEHHDRIRQAKAFRRLTSSCDFPYLLVEASPAELLATNKIAKQPELICHRLGLALAQYGLHALFIPWKSRSAEVRRKIGTLMLHIMVACIVHKTYTSVAVKQL